MAYIVKDNLISVHTVRLVIGNIILGLLFNVWLFIPTITL